MSVSLGKIGTDGARTNKTTDHERKATGKGKFTCFPNRLNPYQGLTMIDDDRQIRRVFQIVRSKRLQGRLLIFLNVEQLVELGNLENFVNVLGNVAHHQFAAAGLNLFVQGNEFAQCSAGEIFDVAEVQQYFLPPQLIDKAEEILADFLYILLIKNFAVNEIDHGDIAVIFDFQSPAPGL